MGKASPEQLMKVLDEISNDPDERVDDLIDGLLLMNDLADRIAQGEHMLSQDWAAKKLDDVTYIRLLTVYKGLVGVKTTLDSMLERLTAEQRDRVRIGVVKAMLE